MHKIYVIIVTYNGSKWIDKCFGSLVNSNFAVNIVVVDNNSTDGTPKIIKEKYPHVEIIETGQNLGFGKANNVGLKIALEKEADYTLLLNQDAWIKPDTLEKLVVTHKHNSEYDLISPLHLNGSGDAIDRNFQNYLAPQNTPGFLSDAALGKLSPMYASNYANAAAWFLTRKAIIKIGGFDPLFKHYGEDNDYINRLHDLGLKMAIDTTSIIYHDRPQNGELHAKFYQNQTYTQALLSVKTKPQPYNHFLIRRIIANYFALFFCYFGKNDNLRRLVNIDKTALKLKKISRKHLSFQEQETAFL